MASSGDDVFSQFNFPGGFPSSSSLAPSIVFLIAYVIATPLLVYRLVKRETRCVPLIRPAVFLLARWAMLILRAIMSKNNYGESELIAELILVSVGTLFLIEPLVELFKRHVAAATRMDEAPAWVQRLSLFLQLGVLAAIALTIAGSAQISSAIDDPSKLKTVMDLRKAASIIQLAVVVITGVAAVLTHFTFGLEARKTAFIVGCELCLTVLCVYRAVQTFSLNPNTDVHKPVVFWICQMLFEYIVFVGLIVIRIPEWYPSEDSQAQRDRDTDLVAIDNAKHGGAQRGYPPQYPPRAQNETSQA